MFGMGRVQDSNQLLPINQQRSKGPKHSITPIEHMGIDHGVSSGWGRNDTLSVPSMSLDDVRDGILADAKIASDPAVAEALGVQRHDFRC